MFHNTTFFCKKIYSNVVFTFVAFETSKHQAKVGLGIVSPKTRIPKSPKVWPLYIHFQWPKLLIQEFQGTNPSKSCSNKKSLSFEISNLLFEIMVEITNVRKTVTLT